jgi:hypothetical protein
MWKNILHDNSDLNFTRHSVYSLWSKLNEVDWKRHDNPLISTCLLIKEAKVGKLRKDKVYMITLPTEEGFTADFKNCT